jgi:hypothetical protein
MVSQTKPYLAQADNTGMVLPQLITSDLREGLFLFPSLFCTVLLSVLRPFLLFIYFLQLFWFCLAVNKISKQVWMI